MRTDALVDSDMIAAAAVSCARGTTRGVAASNAGRCSDASPIISAAITYSGHSSGCGSSALTSRSTAHPARPGSDQRISARRSNRSASTPPYSPNTRRATSAACDPRYATVLLVNIARNPAAPGPRSGVTSGTSADQLTRTSPTSPATLSAHMSAAESFSPGCPRPDRVRLVTASPVPPRDSEFPTLADIHAAALRRLPQDAATYLESGAGTEPTLRANREAFTRWVIRPRPMTGVSDPKTNTELLGIPLSVPVLTAPFGGDALFDP